MPCSIAMPTMRTSSESWASPATLTSPCSGTLSIGSLPSVGSVDCRRASEYVLGDRHLDSMARCGSVVDDRVKAS
jgi:hypothetical protein